MTAAPVTIIDTKPPYRTWRAWDGNQATYLFFPVFIAFLLVLLSTLSDPIIPGMSVVDVHGHVKGHEHDHDHGKVRFGTWGWCVHGMKGVQ